MKKGANILYSGCTDKEGKKWPGGKGKIMRVYKDAGTVAISLNVWPSEYKTLNQGNDPKWMIVPISSVCAC